LFVPFVTVRLPFSWSKEFGPCRSTGSSRRCKRKIRKIPSLVPVTGKGDFSNQNFLFCFRNYKVKCSKFRGFYWGFCAKFILFVKSWLKFHSYQWFPNLTFFSKIFLISFVICKILHFLAKWTCCKWSFESCIRRSRPCKGSSRIWKSPSKIWFKWSKGWSEE
jgi:hypothetical protein